MKKLSIYIFMVISLSFVGEPTQPDSMINKYELINSKEILEDYGDVTNCCSLKDHATVSGFAEVILLSKDKRTYLALILFNGGSVNEFERFRVGYTGKDSTSFSRAINTDIATFITGNRIELGITISELKERLPLEYKDSKMVEGDKLTFNCGDWNKCSILKKYNMPEYEANYHFLNGKLVSFDFGFVYP